MTCQFPVLGQLTAADVFRVLDMERRCHLFPWTEHMIRDSLEGEHLNLAGFLEDLLVGYAFMMSALDEMHLLSLTIDVPWQGRGWGRYLLEAVMERARTLDCHSLFLEVRAGNARARNLYERAGFQVVGVRRGYYPGMAGREDALVMRAFT